MDEDVTVTLEREKEHTRTWRYKETGSTDAIGHLYLAKRVADQLGNPQRITLIIGRG